MATLCAGRPRKLSAVIPVVCGLIWIAIGSESRAASASAILAATSAITAEDAQGLVSALADDSLEGRETGTRGGRAAGAYLGQQFQQFHLRGGGVDGGYYQPFGGS